MTPDDAQESDTDEDEGEDGEEDYDEDFDEEYEDGIPNAVSVFFSHSIITAAIDKIESVYLDRSGDWNIAHVISEFITMSDHRNREKLTSGPRPTKVKMMEYAKHLYESKFKPFLNHVGIKVNALTNSIKTYVKICDDFTWKWQDSFTASSPSSFSFSFSDIVLIPTFKNLTANGTVAHSRLFLELFPKLFLMADPGTHSSVSHVCD